LGDPEAAHPGAARSDPRRRRRRRGRRSERETGRARREPASSSPPSEARGADADRFLSEAEGARSPARDRGGRARAQNEFDDLELEEVGDAGLAPIEDEDFLGDELTGHHEGPADEEIDVELEQEIRREIEEIEELEREMGLRGPAEARRRGEDAFRG